MLRSQRHKGKHAEKEHEPHTKDDTPHHHTTDGTHHEGFHAEVEHDPHPGDRKPHHFHRDALLGIKLCCFLIGILLLGVVVPIIIIVTMPTPMVPTCMCVNETLLVDWDFRGEGVAIAINPLDSRIYYVSGGSAESDFAQSFDIGNMTKSPNLATVPFGAIQEVGGMAFYPPFGGWLVMERLVPGDIWRVSLDFATWTFVAPHPDLPGAQAGMRGVAVVDGTRVFVVDPFVPELWELDTPSFASVLAKFPLTLAPGGDPVIGAVGITFNPVDGFVYILYRVPGMSVGFPRQVGIIDITTGIITATCLVVTDIYAAIAVDSLGNLLLAAGNRHANPSGLYVTTFPCVL